MEKGKTPKYKIADIVTTKMGCEHIVGQKQKTGIITRMIQGWDDRYYYELNNSGEYYPENTLLGNIIRISSICSNNLS